MPTPCILWNKSALMVSCGATQKSLQGNAATLHFCMARGVARLAGSRTEVCPDSPWLAMQPCVQVKSSRAHPSKIASARTPAARRRGPCNVERASQDGLLHCLRAGQSWCCQGLGACCSSPSPCEPRHERSARHARAPIARCWARLTRPAGPWRRLPRTIIVRSASSVAPSADRGAHASGGAPFGGGSRRADAHRRLVGNGRRHFALRSE
jgi:hypothetical protein